MKFDIHPEQKETKKEKINEITQKILDCDFSKIEPGDLMDFLSNIVRENRPVMYEEEIRSLYNKYIGQSKNKEVLGKLCFEMGRAIMDYTSDTKNIDQKTKENTLDRSYKVFFEVAETNPEEMRKLSSWTHHLFEFVKPEVFFETYIKIINSKPLNEYFGGEQFSQLEYNMSYCGAEKYVSALLKEIDFKKSSSCLKSSQLINLAFSLASYARSGSYSGNYEVDTKIIDGLKPVSRDKDSIYLLGSKTKYMISIFEKGYHPFIHKENIFKISPGKFASIKNGNLFVTRENLPKEFFEKIKEYDNLCVQLNTPPKELVDEAIRLGRDYIEWTPDRTKMILRDKLQKEIFLSMDTISINNKKLWNNKINNPQLNEYINLIGTDYKDFLEEEFNFDFSKFSIPEQFYFLEFIQKQTNFSILPVKGFTKKFGKDGFRTFLSIEQGGREMGDKILTLGEKLPEDITKKVFEKYGEIIDNVNKITEFARNNFTKEIETTPELIQKIEETLYIKGKQLLSQTYDDISSKKEIDYEDIIKKLDRINADTITTFAIFKQAVKNGEKLPIESIEGSVFSKKEATSIPKEQQDEMLELYEINWRNHPDRNFVESLKTYFKTAFIPEMNQKRNNFYTFEKDNKIRAFVRFEEKGKNNLYASALNVDEASKNFGLGEAMMDEALVREAQENILHASCRKDNPSNMRYFEKGFISRGFKKTENTEEFDLVWDENRNKNISAKQKTKEELIDMYTNGNYEDNIEIEKSQNLEELNSSIPQGKSLVRCFLNKGEWYAVYENVSPDYGVNLEEVE